MSDFMVAVHVIQDFFRTARIRRTNTAVIVQALVRKRQCQK
jgi:hypothetical protein